MSRQRPWSYLVTTLAWLGCQLPGSALAESPTVTPVAGRPLCWDVRLDPTGRLRGVVLDAAANPQADVPLTLRTSQGPSVTEKTDLRGEFEFPAERGGVYELAAGDRVLSLRCWQGPAAPPHAVDRLVLSTVPTYRGQVEPSCWGLSNPWVIAGIVVAAVAIPVAVYSNRENREASSE